MYYTGMVCRTYLAVQGHARSLFLTPIKSAYATSFLFSIATTFSEIRRFIGRKLPILPTHSHLMSLFGANFWIGFLPARRYASAGLCDSDVSGRPSVCPSFRLSHAGIVPSRAKSWNVHHLILHSSFWRGMIHRKIRKGSPQRNVPNEGGLGFFCDFRPICRHISKTVHFRYKVTMGR